MGNALRKPGRGVQDTPPRARSHRPAFLPESRGAWLKGAHGHQLLDLDNNDGQVLLGWNDAGISRAISEADGDTSSLMGQLASQLSARVIGAEAVAFAPSLSDALASTLMAAKALTGRDGAFLCDEATALSGDVETLEQAVSRHADQLAALVIRPLDVPRRFLMRARLITERIGAVLIFDESRSMLRVHDAGVAGLYGISADVTVLGPALANGRALGAICGHYEIMRAVDADLGALSPAALREALIAGLHVLSRFDTLDGPRALAVVGAEIEVECARALRRHGADGLFELCGDPAWSVVRAREGTGHGTGLGDELSAALEDAGVMSLGSHVPSLAIDESHIIHMVAAYDAALPALMARHGA